MSASRLLRAVFVILGLICVGLGTLGIVLPVLPTTPFILLAAYFFVRSSPRLHAWLMRHPRYGPMIRKFQKGQGLTLRVKLTSLAMAYATVTVSIIVVDLLPVRIFLVVLMAIMTGYMIKIPTCLPGPDTEDTDPS